MAAKICSPISSPAETGSPHTELGNLLESYIWCARAEGKSPATIEIRITAVLALIDFLRSSGLSTCVHDIGAYELRRFILHLQGVRAYQSHPFSRPRKRGLSGHTINGYLRSLRAFW